MTREPPHLDPQVGRMRQTLPRFSLQQSVLMNLLFVVLILAGTLVIQIMPVDVYPDVDLDEASIETFWPGASAEDVERLITDRIEAKIQDIRGVTRILSDSKPDASLIRVKFREDLSDAELHSAFRQLRAAVDRVVDLPTDSEKPLVTRISLGEIFPLLWVVVQDVGGVDEGVLHELVLKLRPILRDIRGVAKVDDKLIRDRELLVSVDRETLRKLDLTLDEVAAVLKQYNRTVPSGVLTSPRGEISVRAVGEVTTPQQLGDIAVRKNPQGAHVYLRDIATITTGFERQKYFARLNGHICKALGIAKTDEADSTLVAQRVREVIARFQRNLPPELRDEVRVTTCLDSSDIIESRIRILGNNLVGGIALVFVALWLVMGFRNSLLAVIGIPFSFLCALIVMHLMGVTINAVSLFALVLCSGMIVDDAIVVLENIYRHIELNKQRDDERGFAASIIDGTNEVMWPVISSSATTIVAFLPMLLMGGVTGEFFSIIPKTVMIILLVSLAECLLMVPVHYHAFGPRTAVTPIFHRLKLFRRADGSMRQSPIEWVIGWYDVILAFGLRHRYLAPVPLLAMGFMTYCMIPLLRVDLFPSDFQLVVVDIKTWDEASLDQTGKVVEPIEKLMTAMGDEYVHSVLAVFGLTATEDHTPRWRNNLAQLHIQLADTDVVNADPDAVAGMIRDRMQRYVAEHPGCGIQTFRVWAPQDGPPIGKPVAIRIESTNLRLAKSLAEQYKERLAKMPGVFGISDDLDFGPKQFNLRLNEDRASAYGLTQPRLAQALRTANDGLIVSTFKDRRSGEDLDVRLLFKPKDRKTLDDLLDINIRTPGGYLVQLKEISELDMSQGYASVPHFNTKRVVTVTAQLDTSVTTAHAVNTQIRREFRTVLAARPNVRVTYGGEFGETLSSFDSLARAYIVAMIVVYMLLATQFRSYAQPFVVMFTVPFASVGVVAGLLLSGYPVTIMTAIAMVGLTGVVVNDSIVLLDFINKRTADGSSMADSIRIACSLRFRPVMLTTVTTVLGLLPLALGWGGTSKIWSPFASSFAWGLAFSTVVTLVIEPAFYLILHDVISFLKGSNARPEGDSEPASANSPVK